MMPRPLPFVALLCFAFGYAQAQINCPPHLPLTLLGNTSYCIGSDGSDLSVQQSYAGYEWLPTAETGQDVLLTAGEYHLVVTHYTGCTDTLAFTVEQVSNPPQPVIDVQGPTEFCEGGSVLLSAPAGYPYYEWNTGSVGQNLTIFETGTYVVSVTDWIGCTSASNSLLVVVNPLPVAAFSPNLNGYDISFLNLSENATSYEWHFGDGTTSNEFEPNYTYTLGGNMPLYLVATNDCTSDTAFLDLENVSVSDPSTEVVFDVYPNPCPSHLTLALPTGVNFDGTGTVSIISVDGRTMFSHSFVPTATGSKMVVDVSGLANGIYLLQLNDGTSVSSKTVVVQH